MRLTRQSSYAVRTLVYCAVKAPELSRVAEIAKAHSISELFLFKLIKPLVEAGLLETVRGRCRVPPLSGRSCPSVMGPPVPSLPHRTP